MPFAMSPAYLILLVLPLLAAGSNDTRVQHLPLRLADGWKPGTGRVEIKDVDNVWKVICEEDWDINDSHVACRQLGFPGALRWYPSRVNRDRPFYRGLGSCNGDESFLNQCLSGSAEDCHDFSQTDADVAVECEASVQLVGGESENEGRVEVYIDGTWATVCGLYMDFDTANVLCLHMDFSSAIEITKQPTLQGNGSVLDVTCSKGSFLKENCTMKRSDCSHEWDAGLVCQLYPDGAVRLFEAASPREGFIAIHHNGSWGAVCNDWWDFDTIAAGVACRQLGYGSAISVLYGEWHGSGNAVIPRFFYNRFKCTGSESSLIQCPHSEESPVTCTTNTFAGVKCGEFDVTQSQIALVKESNSAPNGTGQLMLKYRTPGSSGLTAKPVCYNRWDIADAQVACRQMGYKQATSTMSIFGYADYNSKRDKGWLDGLQCNGDEKALYNCNHRGWGDHNCYHSGFVAISCSNEYPSLRLTLAGGRNNAEGVLQVEYQGRRGAVCGDGWSMNAAVVACRQLGYTTALRTSSGEEFGGRPGYMWMSYVVCSGNEEKLQECTHSGLGDFSKSCTHPIGVGVVCGDPPFQPPLPNWSVHLVGRGEGEGPMGRVEVFHNGQWKGLCMNDFGRSEAQAVCRSLDYADGLPIVEKSAQFVGLGYSSLWMVQLDCSVSRGSDRGLAACSTIGWSPEPCRRTQPGVLCSGAPLTVQNLKLQLNGGRRKGEGIVEVGIGNTWGAVCIDHWEMHTARLICKRLGYQTALASVKNIPLRTKFATRDLIHFVNRFHCSGEETSINECELVWETGQCQGGKDAYAGVVCSDTEVSLPVRLVAGRNKYEGNVQLQYEGEWGYVCGAGWDMRDADVVCKQLGSVGAVEVKHFRDYSVCRVWLDQVNCTGSESSLWGCSHTGLGMFEGDCTAEEYAGIECQEAAITQIDRSAPTDHIEHACNLLNHPIIGVPDHSVPTRLVSFGKNSTSTGRGRVEVLSRLVWGSICDDGWDLRDANVTCRALGFEGAERIAEVEEFGKGTGHIWMDDVDCVGTEISLDYCKSNGPGRSNCIHNEDAGVVCITDELVSEATVPGSINSVTIAIISVMAVLIVALAVTIFAMRLRRMKKPKKSIQDQEVTLQYTSSTQLQDENGTECESDITMATPPCGHLDTLSLSKQLP